MDDPGPSYLHRGPGRSFADRIMDTVEPSVRLEPVLGLMLRPAPLLYNPETEKFVNVI